MSASSYNPRTGGVVATAKETTSRQLADVIRRAAAAAPIVAATSPAERQAWIVSIADALEKNREELAALAEVETALGQARLAGEVDRAAGQLRFYADVAVEGSYVGVTVDRGTDDRPALIRVNRPLGPVAVFGASNFPFAFSVLGNDTGAALAAGCPVVAKVHSAHLALSLRQAEIAREALDHAGAPTGTFDIVIGHQAGIELVKASAITALAFTGSQSGGLALWRLANEREAVIPVYAEMGTVNPVVVTRAGAADMAAVAAGFVDSFTLGNGQFCTKPGLMLAPAHADAPALVADALRRAAPSPLMLTQAIAQSVTDGIEELQAAGAAAIIRMEHDATGWAAPAAVLSADLSALRPGSRLVEECFGSVVLVVEYDSDEQLLRTLTSLQPSLAASLFTGDVEDLQAPGLIEALSHQVGRVAVNDWPTGVAYSWAQQHGGPWPATSVPSATSVGAQGLARFVRPVAFQSAHDAWLPAEARTHNPWGLPRRVDGLHEAAR